ncbi:ABC transporter ATP-binding protein [Agrobacterium vitis]|uniref:OsmC family protein n=1 Tax=Agrobacterium vitis TaxID=373 RepID=UPI0015D805C6|nr:OsmC family protein [Agrobacterium vitis]BCH60630.1 ABC transporter ATP-binding protein [Agrobacterium vitis]
MAEIKMKTRPVGATAVIGRTGFPQITSATGGELAIVTGPSQPGFNPLDLLYASLAGCLTISARLAASEMGVMDRISEITAKVTGEKAKAGLSRVERFDITLTIKGEIDDETRKAIADRAEHEICTVSNTISGNPQFVTTLLQS